MNEAGDKNSTPIHENLDMKKASFTMPAKLSRLTVTNIFKKKMNAANNRFLTDKH